ncbi:MAG: hypothetical protein E6G00_10395 [Actinobacteria bacterium]|nr:MAG: hypothetical protein E6G00_10395 [Actinomycetota bacterium]
MRSLRSSIDRRGVFALVICAAALAAAAPRADAATIHVTSMADSGPGTLRNAIATASPGSTIIVPAGTIKLTSAQLDVTKKLEIDGAGATATIVSGNDAHRVFSLAGAVGVKITKLSIVHGRVAQVDGDLSGGGVTIDAASSLTLDSARVRDNVVDVSGDATHPGGNANGGGIFNAGTLALVRSAVDHNTANANATAGDHPGGIVSGGGIDNKGGLSVTTTSISSNTATGVGHGTSGGGIIDGGGVYNETGSLAITDGSLDKNTANGDGGANGPGGIVDGGGLVHAGGALALTRTSVSGNTASGLGHGAGGGGIVDAGGLENEGGDLSLVRATIDGNVARADGGASGSGGSVSGAGIFQGGTKLTIGRSSISNNTASATGAGTGGIIFGGGLDDGSTSPTTITNSRFSANGANADGSPAGDVNGVGIFLGGSLPTVSASTVDGNHGTARGAGSSSGGSGLGGGVYVAVPTTMTNVTLNANSLDVSSSSGSGGSAIGGGAFVNDTLTSVNSTIAGSSVRAAGAPAGTARGGNLAQSGGVAHVKNTIISGGSGDPSFENCREPATSDGHNIDSLDQCGFHSTGDQINKNPLLGPLQDNGGPVPTRALLPHSPAINKGDNVGCPATDARGFHRPAFGICDIGAFEVNPDHSPPSITIVTPAAGAHYKQGQKVIANYSCSDPEGPFDIVLCQGPVPNGKPIATSTPGPHKFIVQAADKSGNSTKKTVRYTVDTTESSPPKLKGLPPNQGCVPGNLKLKISVHPRRLRRAAVFLDGKLIASSKKADFKVKISGKQLSPGRHTIKILREYKSGTKRRSTVSFTRCRKGGRSPHIHTEGTPDQGSCTAKPFKIFVSITRVDAKTILVKLDGKRFAKPGKAKFTLSIDVRKLKAGPHKLIIKASDKFKNGSVSITDFVRCA